MNIMLSSLEGKISTLPHFPNISKSSRVTQLNGNPFFSKDKLTRLRNSLYFNNDDDYLSVGELHIIIFGYWVKMICIFCA